MICNNLQPASMGPNASHTMAGCLARAAATGRA